MKITIKKIVYPGRSLSEAEGKVVFTDEGLPGEVVEADVIREKTSYIEARTTGIIERSPRRTEPRCGHWKACSPWQVMDYGLQIEVKKGQVEEIFARELRIELEELEIVPSPKIWGYRNRARFHILREGGEARAAYHEPGEESEFIPTGACHLLPDAMNALGADILDTINAFELRAITDIEIRRSSADGRMLAVFEFGPAADLAEIRRAFGGLRDRFPVAGVVGLVRDRMRIREVPLLGKRFLENEAAGARFRIGPRSFFQVNGEMLHRAAGEMRRLAAAIGEPTIADLYCGVGTFGILLAPGAKEVFGVESDEENLRFLEHNLRANRIGNYAVCEGKSEEWIGELLEKGVDCVILDPPRKGVDPAIVQRLAENPAGTILYLSCNPATLARDLKGLLPAYDLAEIKVFDFFPHTPHIETLAVLKRGRA
ncbi:MAG: 23S rRNA (uracil(1939)-C(5))-methyltransferase RlmD [Candidatus Aminicenantales bacterium]